MHVKTKLNPMNIYYVIRSLLYLTRITPNGSRFHLNIKYIIYI